MARTIKMRTVAIFTSLKMSCGDLNKIINNNYLIDELRFFLKMGVVRARVFDGR